MDGVAIDPGGAHVGIAWFEWAGGGEDHMRVVDTAEFTPEHARHWIWELCHSNRVDVVVCEKFALFGDRAMAQVGSEMETSQLIGVIKFACETSGVPYVEQQPDIKKPTTAILKRRGIPSVAKKQKTGGHALDAELHAWRYLESRKSTWTGKPDEPEVTGYAE